MVFHEDCIDCMANCLGVCCDNHDEAMHDFFASPLIREDHPPMECFRTDGVGRFKLRFSNIIKNYGN